MTAVYTPLVGLLGRKRSGKDTVAARLVEAHGFARLAFADALREAALSLDPIVLTPHGWRLSDIVRIHGWEDAKAFPEVRRTLQRCGMAIREVDPDFWLRIVMRQAADLVYIESRPVVITDVRFPNEAEAIVKAGGVLVRVIRPGLGYDEADEHESEKALLDWPTDFTLMNDADLSTLRDRVDELATRV